ncbi:hypothetical protein NC653_001054 [Populus alba x Populus x berolinensis]|uniref:Uncharacterized protein n=1 Tax=Populus alba x Populus x berolinensis TaxID=444605 RepID=A0AAD6WF51_9ROSI|nr:hypothetical protein NC653_001054 [Populus alba x Populus x berolinensis]
MNNHGFPARLIRMQPEGGASVTFNTAVNSIKSKR